MVFSTLHTNDAAGGVTRLIDMGVEPFLISSSLECLIAQRLVRLVCPNCKVSYQVTKEALRDFNLGKEQENIEIFKGKGCSLCKFSGYKGRTGIHEVMLMNNALREMVIQKASSQQIKKKAIECGMRTLRQDGWDKIAKGLTTVEEVLRVTQQEELVD